MESTTVPSVGSKLHPSQRIPDQRVTLFIRVYAIRYVGPITYLKKTRLLFRILFVRLATKSFQHNYYSTQFFYVIAYTTTRLLTEQGEAQQNAAAVISPQCYQPSFHHRYTFLILHRAPHCQCSGVNSHQQSQLCSGF